MATRRINLISSVVLVLLSLTALVTVVSGLILPPPMPEPDEGARAHIFQLSIAALLPVAGVVLVSTDWRESRRTLLPLVIAAAATALAFGGLYSLEHLR